MAKILPLKAATPEKFGYKKARRQSSAASTAQGQFDLFARQAARIVTLPTGLSPFYEALLYDERGNAEKAYATYERAIDEGDYVADAYCNLGILESLLGETDRAIECFKNSLKEDPGLFESHFNLANVYLDVGEYRPAQVHYEIGASIQPDYANVYFNLALALAMQDRYEQAVEALEAYRRLSADADVERADSLLRSLRQSILGA